MQDRDNVMCAKMVVSNADSRIPKENVAKIIS